MRSAGVPQFHVAARPLDRFGRVLLHVGVVAGQVMKVMVVTIFHILEIAVACAVVPLLRFA